MSSYLSQFNYQLYGPESGRKWVFLHGLMGYGANWRKIVAGLEKTERILTFDQRGHGRSFHPASGYAPEDYADDLFRITQELSWNKFILVGHSMGGRNAMAFASKYPERLEKLVIEDIGPQARPEAIDRYRNLFASVPTPFASRREARDFFTKVFPELWTGKNAQTVGAYLMSNMEENKEGQLDWRFSKEAMIDTVILGRAKDQWRELQSLSVPCLFIRGADSDEFSHEELEKVRVSNPRISAIEVANAGHWVHFDQPEEFLRALIEFAGA